MKGQLPSGVQDYLYEECFNRELIAKRLSDLFRQNAFLEIYPPALEYFDSFCSRGLRANRMFRFTDSDGELLVLRPDPTLQIARIAATKLDTQSINKIFYNVSSFEFSPDKTAGRTREFPQVGVELIGAGGYHADADIISLACDALDSLGISFQIDIGHAGFLDGFVTGAGLAAEARKRLNELVCAKDLSGISRFLTSQGIPEQEINRITAIPMLFGGEEVIAAALMLCDNDGSKRAASELSSLCKLLNLRGKSGRFKIDMGMAYGPEYYTGVIFKAYVPNLGEPLAEGGRYDSLCSGFGKELPAVGFAISVKRALIALENIKKLKMPRAFDCAYIILEDCKEAYAMLGSLKEKGLTLDRQYFETEQELTDYCKRRGIKFSAVLCENSYIKEVE